MKTTTKKACWLSIIVALGVLLLAAASCEKKGVRKEVNPGASLAQTAWKGTYEEGDAVSSSDEDKAIAQVAFLTENVGSYLLINPERNELARFTYEHTGIYVKIQRIKNQPPYSSELDGDWFIKERSKNSLVLEKAISSKPTRLRLTKTNFAE